jgi:hypothetical protein
MQSILFMVIFLPPRIFLKHGGNRPYEQASRLPRFKLSIYKSLRFYYFLTMYAHLFEHEIATTLCVRDFATRLCVRNIRTYAACCSLAVFTSFSCSDSHMSTYSSCMT